MDDLFHKPVGPAPPPPAPAQRTLREITLIEEIQCVKREIGYRHRVYRWRVAQHKMKQAEMDREIDVMCAVLRRLEDLAAGHCKHCGAVSD